jgi:hypothetical protein
VINGTIIWEPYTAGLVWNPRSWQISATLTRHFHQETDTNVETLLANGLVWIELKKLMNITKVKWQHWHLMTNKIGLKIHLDPSGWIAPITPRYLPLGPIIERTAFTSKYLRN